MAALKITLVAMVALVGLVAAMPDIGYGNGNGNQPGMPYDFSYTVNEDGNDFGHSESSDGNLVTGEYYVLLPDGRRQIVTYQADHDSGYVADVKYEGEAQYPPAPAPGGYQ